MLLPRPKQSLGQPFGVTGQVAVRVDAGTVGRIDVLLEDEFDCPERKIVAHQQVEERRETILRPRTLAMPLHLAASEVPASHASAIARDFLFTACSPPSASFCADTMVLLELANTDA